MHDTLVLAVGARDGVIVKQSTSTRMGAGASVRALVGGQLRRYLVSQTRRVHEDLQGNVSAPRWVARQPDGRCCVEGEFRDDLLAHRNRSPM